MRSIKYKDMYLSEQKVYRILKMPVNKTVSGIMQVKFSETNNTNEYVKEFIFKVFNNSIYVDKPFLSCYNDGNNLYVCFKTPYEELLEINLILNGDTSCVLQILDNTTEATSYKYFSDTPIFIRCNANNPVFLPKQDSTAMVVSVNNDNLLLFNVFLKAGYTNPLPDFLTGSFDSEGNYTITTTESNVGLLITFIS